MCFGVEGLPKESVCSGSHKTGFYPIKIRLALANTLLCGRFSNPFRGCSVKAKQTGPCIHIFDFMHWLSRQDQNLENSIDPFSMHSFAGNPLRGPCFYTCMCASNPSHG